MTFPRYDDYSRIAYGSCAQCAAGKKLNNYPKEK